MRPCTQVLDLRQFCEKQLKPNNKASDMSFLLGGNTLFADKGFMAALVFWQENPNAYLTAEKTVSDTAKKIEVTWSQLAFTAFTVRFMLVCMVKNMSIWIW